MTLCYIHWDYVIFQNLIKWLNNSLKRKKSKFLIMLENIHMMYILGKEFKLVNATDYYQYDKKYNVYKDKTDDTKYMQKLIENGENIKIVGIVQPAETATATMLRSGIGYPASLTTHVIEKAQASDIVKKQLEDSNVDVFTGKKFSDKESNKMDMNSLFTVDANIMKKAFTFESKLAFYGIWVVWI